MSPLCAAYHHFAWPLMQGYFTEARKALVLGKIMDSNLKSSTGLYDLPIKHMPEAVERGRPLSYSNTTTEGWKTKGPETEHC